MEIDFGKILGAIGDRDAIDHDGGFVFENQYGIQFVWIENDTESMDETRGVTVYRGHVPDAVMEYFPVQWGRVLKSIGSYFHIVEYERMFASNADPMKRMNALWDLARYYGWHYLDHDPLNVTAKEAEEMYGDALDKANER